MNGGSSALAITLLPQSGLAKLCSSVCEQHAGTSDTPVLVLSLGVTADGTVVRISPHDTSTEDLFPPVSAEDMFGADNGERIVRAIGRSLSNGFDRLQLEFHPHATECVHAELLLMRCSDLKSDAVCDLVLIVTCDQTRTSVSQQFRYLERAADDARDGLIITDGEGTIVHISAGATSLFGYEASELMGQPIDVLMPEPYRSRHAHFVADFRKTGRGKILGVGPRELPALAKDGRTFPIELSVSQAEWNGKLVLIGLCRDISARMARERELRDAERNLNEHILKLEATNAELARQQAEAAALADRLKLARDEARAANNAKSDFLATMSHEIRTPLNGIIGMVQILATSRLDTAQRENLAIIAESAETLLGLLNELLDLSKIEAGRMTLEPREIGLRRFLAPIIDHWRHRAQAKALTLTVDLPDDVPDTATIDPVRLRQVLDNLLSNAVKFTEKGTVRLALTVEQAAADLHGLRFIVADSGIGIAPETLGRVFDSFTQADASISRRYGGTGLGLAITRRLIQLMNGTISVTSEPGTGTEFRLFLPCRCNATTCTARAKVAPPSPATRVKVTDDASLRILVAEDNLVNQKVVRTILGALGHVVTVTANGREAIICLDGGGDFDLILMDLHMPEMDGLTATRAIRSRTDHYARIPIIGLTASAMDRDRELCLAAGMVDFVTKPIKIEALATALAEASALRSLAPSGAGR